jgi:hypothetical protein
VRTARTATLLCLAITTGLESRYLRSRVPDNQWRRADEAGKDSRTVDCSARRSASSRRPCRQHVPTATVIPAWLVRFFITRIPIQFAIITPTCCARLVHWSRLRLANTTLS